MKTTMYIIAALLALNSSALLAGNDDVIVTHSINSNISSLAPVTPKEAGFEEITILPVINDQMILNLEPKSAGEANFEETTDLNDLNTGALLPTLPKEASFED